jgi:cobalt-zinc-cadmium efflux system outer membrane protein
MAHLRVLPTRIVGSALWLCVALATPTTTLAQPAGTVEDHRDGSPQREVTWPEIVRLVDAHPRIVAGQHETRAARAAVDAAGAAPNPRLEGSVAYGRARDGSASKVVRGLELSIPLGWIARRGARIAAAEAEARSAAAEAQALRRDLLLQLGQLFWSLVYEQARVAALGELSEQTRALARTVGRRVDQGEARPVEATRVELEAEKIAGDLELARSSLATRRSQLSLWLGVDPGRQQVRAVADLAALPRPMTTNRARRRAGAGHPAIAAAKARVAARAADHTLQRRARIPSVALAAFADHELDRRAYGVGLAIDLPLWNWNTGAIQRSADKLAAARNRVDAETRAREATAIAAQARCQAGVTLSRRYRQRILPRATSAAQTIEKTYRLGEASLLEVIDARRTLLETRRQFLAALVQAQTDCHRLDALAGEETR